MSQNQSFVNTKVFTKSLLGRSALIGKLQESKSMSPEKVNEAFVTKEEKTLVGSSPIHFNNNIYNNV